MPWAGRENVPAAKKEAPVAAHLRCMSPAEAAYLQGVGSRPLVADKGANAQTGIAAGTPALNELPLPLFRSTGSFDADYAMRERALAESTADLVVSLEATSTLVTTPAAARSGQHILAAQLAVVSRLNKPTARIAAVAAAQASAIAHSAPAKGRTPSKVVTPKVAALRQRIADSATSRGMKPQRSQAVIIDLAAIKVQRRQNNKVKRAA